jgi:hypothetical protein
LASIRTVLNVAEKALEACPISWPKAAVGAAAESLEAIQVCRHLYSVVICG